MGCRRPVLLRRECCDVTLQRGRGTAVARVSIIVEQVAEDVQNTKTGAMRVATLSQARFAGGTGGQGVGRIGRLEVANVRGAR